MNTSARIQKRNMRKRTLSLEQLDARIVPSGVAAAAAAVQAEAVTDAARGILRHELRVERLIRRHELQVARLGARELRLEARYAARHHLDATVTAVPAVPVASGSQPVSTSPSAATPTAPVSVSSPSSNSPPVVTTPPSNPTTPVSTTGTAPSSPTTPVSTTGPLPSNVASALDTIYEEYENGTLPTSNGPGQIEIQGNDVGVMIKVTNPSDFGTVSADAQALGLQVTGTSPSTDTIAGWLPISELPAVAQFADAPIIVPIYGPIAS